MARRQPGRREDRRQGHGRGGNQGRQGHVARADGRALVPEERRRRAQPGAHLRRGRREPHAHEHRPVAQDAGGGAHQHGERAQGTRRSRPPRSSERPNAEPKGPGPAKVRALCFRMAAPISMLRPSAALAICCTTGCAGPVHRRHRTRARFYLHRKAARGCCLALHAQSIAATLHDTNGRLLPLFFQMPEIGGERAWCHPNNGVRAGAVFFTVLRVVRKPSIRLPTALTRLTERDPALT